MPEVQLREGLMTLGRLVSSCHHRFYRRKGIKGQQVQLSTASMIHVITWTIIIDDLGTGDYVTIL